VEFGPVNVHGVYPGRRRKWRVLAADEAVAPAAAAALAWGVPLVANQQGPEERRGKWFSFTCFQLDGVSLPWIEA
jgi:hypothetical protein